MIFTTNSLLISYFFTCLAYGIVVQDPPSPKHHGSVHLHQRKKMLPHLRQLSPQCDLICPCNSTQAIPAIFVQNCNSSGTKNNSTQNTQSSGKVTTLKPSTTTESGEESTETVENTEESAEKNTKTASEQTKRNENSRHQKHKGRNHPNEVKKKPSQSKHQHQNKKQFRKAKVLIKPELKKELLKHKHLKGRSNLNGCCVVCPNSEGTESGHPGNSGNEAELDQDDSTSEESNDDLYVPGEDTAIEIIYMPEDKRPVALHPTNNNYAFLEPQPAFGYGFDPFFMEGKQKKINKKKHKNRRKDGASKEKNKNAATARSITK